jgi:hypothetical protein
MMMWCEKAPQPHTSIGSAETAPDEVSIPDSKSRIARFAACTPINNLLISFCVVACVQCSLNRTALQCWQCCNTVQHMLQIWLKDGFPDRARRSCCDRRALLKSRA